MNMTITGVEDVTRALYQIRLDELRTEAEALLRDMAADAADYTKAPELPNQRYQRTGDLGRGWTDGAALFNASADALIGEIENSVVYAPDVQGDDQKAIFAGRWRTATMIMDAWEPIAEARMEQAVERMLEHL